jgi:hypothetical protein
VIGDVKEEGNFKKIYEPKELRRSERDDENDFLGN